MLIKDTVRLCLRCARMSRVAVTAAIVVAVWSATLMVPAAAAQNSPTAAAQACQDAAARRRPDAACPQAPGEACAVVVDSVQLRVLFPIGRSEIDPQFGGNGERLEAFKAALRACDADSARRVGSVSIVGYASPDGPYELNQRLSRERANSVAQYIRGFYPQLPDSALRLRYGGIDWEGLEQALRASSHPYAAPVLHLIATEPEFTYNAKGKLTHSRKQRLMDLDGGRPWAQLMQDVFPGLRRSTSVNCYVEAVAECPALPGSDALQPDTVAAVSLVTAPTDALATVSASALEPLTPADEWLRYPVVAFRSNLLVPLLNVGLEVPLSQHWSLGADYYYPWIWPAKSNKNCFELIFISAEARYWFNARGDVPGRNYLTGHSVAAYGAWGYYDFERNYHGHQGHGWSAGVDYQFALPIAKGRLRLEFELAVGVVWSPNAQPYNVLERGGLLFRETGHTKSFAYFGPTKASVSLVLPINRKIRKLEAPMP